MALLSDSASVAALCAGAPILAGGRALYILPWYPGFSEDEFDARQIAPRFPLTLSLPSLPRQFVHEDFIVALALDFATVVPGSVRLSVGPPRVQLFVSSDIPDSILVSQGVVITVSLSALW